MFEQATFLADSATVTHPSMPPRIDIFSCLKLRNGPSRKAASSPFSVSASRPASTVAQRRKHKYRDPYAVAQSRARKAANESRQAALKIEREKALGDPVRGVETPFVLSFDRGLPLAEPEQQGHEEPSRSLRAPPGLLKEDKLNFSLTSDEVRKNLRDSQFLAAPLPVINKDLSDPQRQQEAQNEHVREHRRAAEAISRIVTLSNASAADRKKVNIRRCVETFGRHTTDQHLRPKPASTMPPDPKKPLGSLKTPRAGPDTGSSEVQIAILTAKIRSLANALQTTGTTDKVNKRNLRLLVHRRQKLLAYLRKNERGGERWQHCVETLGLTDGTWKGEISL